MKQLNFIFLILLSITISSCSLSPIKQPPESIYILNPTTSTHSKLTVTDKRIILVMQPETVPFYNTSQMAYSLKPYQISYYAENRWGGTPAQMLEPLIAESLQNTRHFYAVATPPFTGHYDYILNTKVMKLLQDFTYRPAQLRFIVRAQLSRSSTGQVIATKQFSINEPLRSNTPYGGVIAANRATATLLKQLSLFCVEKTR